MKCIKKKTKGYMEIEKKKMEQQNELTKTLNTNRSEQKKMWEQVINMHDPSIKARYVRQVGIIN